MSDIYVTTKMPILALRGLTVFPDQTVHFDIGRMKSALALERAMKHDQILYLVPQKDINERVKRWAKHRAVLSGLTPKRHLRMIFISIG